MNRKRSISFMLIQGLLRVPQKFTSPDFLRIHAPWRF